MPWGDWQFWVVSLAAVGGLGLIVRAVRPAKRQEKRAGLTISAGRLARKR
ncbi:MAG: hypothetical protein RIB58_10910 [Phycisphaerales bacterium]|jgi:hypothetical protein